jgi:hypothetical protein
MKSKWFFAGDGGYGEGVSFKLDDSLVVHECNTLIYLGVKFKIVRHMCCRCVCFVLKKLMKSLV